MLEWTGGSQIYAFSGVASRQKAGNLYTRHFLGFTPADSKDEAYGVAMQIMLAAYPVNDGWYGHDIQLQRLDNVAISRVDIAGIKPVQVGDD